MRFLPLLTLLVLALASPAQAFCGFFVAKADTNLFNRASKVVLARDGDRTVLTMANDFQGDVSAFAMVIPVPTVLQEGQITVNEARIIDHLDAYTAPRLVEYFDRDPCAPIPEVLPLMAMPMADGAGAGQRRSGGPKGYGVTIEAQYQVGEYDILILSAEQSDGLERWLVDNDYRIPRGASEVLGSYIRQDMKFFVARVNLERQAATGREFLRPITVAYESPKFMLPIRLGTVNADGPQELFVFAITPRGRVQTTNYRTTRLPTGDEIPVFVKQEFGDFYRAMFDRLVQREGMRTAILEYAWDMNWCDPCAADPVPVADLRRVGAIWLDGSRDDGRRSQPGVLPPQGINAFVTRLHVRYTADTHPEDLMFQVTDDRENFQGRFVLRHPFTGRQARACPAGRAYLAALPRRFDQEARTLAGLTGWDVNSIRERQRRAMPIANETGRPWWEEIDGDR